jgi:2-keto-4-pentenoate hydratase/2-oxohepta-3-ene-1,7-dioic acid hydratase in catechol pathway
MHIVRYLVGNEEPKYGWVFEDKIGAIEGSPFGEYRRLEAVIPISSVKLLSPVLPSKIVCVGRNYVEHAREHQAEVPEIPLLFLKPPTSVIGPGDAIVLPPQSQQVEHEAELVVVIGKKCRWVAPEDTQNFIFGYTIGNDVTARDLQQKDGQWTRGKGFDTFCPLGPWIETDFDPADGLISCRVNDVMRQMSSTRDMVFTVQQIVAFVSSVMTLLPGDIIMTGTPAGVDQLLPGDEVEVTIEGIGVLKNPVKLERRQPGKKQD